MAYRNIPSIGERVDPGSNRLAVTDAVRRSVVAVAGELVQAVELAMGTELPVTAQAFQELEQRLTRLVQASVVTGVVRAVLQAVHAEDDFVWACVDKARALRGVRPDRKQSVRVRLLCGGVVDVVTPYALQPRPKRSEPGRRRDRKVGGTCCFPVLAQLGIVDNATPALRSEVAWASSALGSLSEAREALLRRGVDLHVNTIRLLTERVADTCLVDRDAEGAMGGTPALLAGKRVVVAIDGGRIRLRKNKRGRARKSGWHGYETPWREPKLMAVYTVGADGRKDGDVVFYEATLASYDDAFALFVRCLGRLGLAQAAEVVFAADGSDHVWARVPAAIKALQIDPAKVYTFVDFWHAAEHLHEASKLVPGLTPYEASLRVRAWRVHLKAGRPDDLALALEAAATTARGDARTQLENHASYFRNNADRMRYPRLRAACLPIGTGAVESAIRRVVNLRLKGAGTFWDEDNAERMLLLRCRLKANRWRDVEESMNRHTFSLRGNALRLARAKAHVPAPA